MQIFVNYHGESRDYTDTKFCFGKRGKLIRRRLLKKDRAKKNRNGNKSVAIDCD